MTNLFVSAEVVSLNLEALDQRARRDFLSVAEVCEALGPRRAPGNKPGRGAEAPGLSTPRDYEIVRVPAIDEAIRAARSDDLKRLLQAVAEQARQLGIMAFVIPGHDGRSALLPGHRAIPQVPAFVREARTVAAIDAQEDAQQPPDAAASAAVAERMATARRWMEPHADAVRLTLAKASRALGFNNFQEALNADSAMGTTMQVFFTYLAFAIASRSASRIGGHALSLDLTVGLVGVIMNPTPEADGEISIPEVAKVLMKVLLRTGEAPWPRHVNSEVFHQMERCTPKEDGAFRDPAPDVLDSALAASLNLALAVRRVWTERAELGLD